MDYVERYVEMFRAKNRTHAQVNGQLFIRKEHWIAPLGPVSQAYRLNEADCRGLLREMGGWWVMWTDGFGPHAADSEWHAVICRRHVPVEEVASGNVRSKLRRGLKNCEARRVDAREIAARGYETYRAAFGHYGRTAADLPSQEAFAKRVLTDEPFGDIRHHWAVYCEGQMVGFAQNLLYGKQEVDYTLIKLHPDFLNRYSSYALFYRMNEFYLAQEGFQYANDGFRSISHATGIQDFLVKEFGFAREPTGLHVHYRPPLGAALGLSRPLGALARRVCPSLAPLLELERLRRK